MIPQSRCMQQKPEEDEDLIVLGMAMAILPWLSQSVSMRHVRRNLHLTYF